MRTFLAAILFLTLLGPDARAEDTTYPWRLFDVSRESDVVYEWLSDRQFTACADLALTAPHSARVVVPGERDWINWLDSDRNGDRLEIRDYDPPLVLTLAKLGGGIRTLRIARAYDLHSTIEGKEYRFFCEYQAVTSHRLTANNATDAILYPESYVDPPSVALLPGRFGVPPKLPRWRKVFGEAKPVRFAIKGEKPAVLPAPLATLFLSPDFRSRFGEKAENTFARFDTLTLRRFKARLDPVRGIETFWNVIFYGEDDAGYISGAWGLFRLTEGVLEPVYLKTHGLPDEHYDLGLITAVMDLDGSGNDAVLIHHQDYEGSRNTIDVIRDGHLVTLFAGGYKGL